MSQPRGGLGRGLEALIPRGAGGLQEIEIDRISPNPDQPRQQFDPEALADLASSIRQHGLLQPLVVTRSGAGYSIVAGERRWRAARAAGLAAVPAIVKETSPQSILELALVENLQRADLSPLEEASAYQVLVERGLTQEQVATRVGRSRAVVANRLRLLGLPHATRDLLMGGSLTEGHARALLGCADPAMLDTLARRVVDRDLSVRETEELVRRLSFPNPESAAPNAGASPQASRPETRDSLEEELQRTLGTKVQITRSRRGGRLVIHFYDEDQLNGLLDALLGRDQS
jgi:ParB family chromosome partitioning protein